MGIVVSYRMATKVKGVPAGLGPPFKSEAKKKSGSQITEHGVPSIQNLGDTTDCYHHRARLLDSTELCLNIESRVSCEDQDQSRRMNRWTAGPGGQIDGKKAVQGGRANIREPAKPEAPEQSETRSVH